MPTRPNRSRLSICAQSLGALALAMLAPAHASAQNLFFGDIVSAAGPNHLFTCDLDGNGLTDILPGPGYVSGVDVDPAGQRVYWSDQLPTGSVRSASFTGASPAVSATGPVHYGLATDTVNQKLYWSGLGGIQRTDYNGASPVTVVAVASTSAIEVDPIAGKLFWANWTVSPPTIHIANLDGTSPQTLVTLPVNTAPNGLAVDPATQTLFFSEYFAGTVSAISYSGGPITTIQSGMVEPEGLDFEPTTNRLYIVEAGTVQVKWCAPTGGTLTTVFTGTGQNYGEMYDIAVVVPAPGSVALVAGVAVMGVRRRRW